MERVRRAGARADHSHMLFSAHQMGTCRMSARRYGGVVKDSGEAWECENLYVADASVFPTPSGANPMITTLAIAHDMASRLDVALQAKAQGKAKL